MSSTAKPSGRDIGRSKSEPKSGGHSVPNHRPPRESKSNLYINCDALPKEFGDVPILRRNDRTRQADNLPEFLRKVREALGATVGKIAVAITTGEMPYHPPIDAIHY